MVDPALLASVFAAGMLATINPCGFAMLPAYVSYFLNRESAASIDSSQDRPAVARVEPSFLIRAILIGASATVGFIALFASVGFVVSLGSRFILRWIPWVGLVIGFLLILLGIWLLTGHHLSFSRLLSLTYKKERALKSYFLFGVAYGLASLTCTLPIFLAVVASTFTKDGMLAAFLQFVAYSLGTGLVVIAVTVSVAFFKGFLVSRLRKAVPFVERASAILLMAMGGYITYYWLAIGGISSGWR